MRRLCCGVLVGTGLVTHVPTPQKGYVRSRKGSGKGDKRDGRFHGRVPPPACWPHAPAARLAGRVWSVCPSLKMEEATGDWVGLSVPAAIQDCPQSPVVLMSTSWRKGGAGIFSLSLLSPLPAVPRQFVCCRTLKHVPSPHHLVLQPRAIVWDFIMMKTKHWLFCRGKNCRRPNCRRRAVQSRGLLLTSAPVLVIKDCPSRSQR